MSAENGLEHLILKETFRGVGGPASWRNETTLTNLADAPTIGVIRDPFDLAASTIKLCRWVTGWRGRLLRVRWPDIPWFKDSDNVAEWAARNWLAFLDWAEQTAIPVFQYEKLTREPAAVLAEICNALRLPCTPSLATSTAKTGVFGGLGDPGVINKPARAIDARSVGHGAALTPVQRERVRQIVASRWNNDGLITRSQTRSELILAS